jgi:hypothetical protein
MTRADKQRAAAWTVAFLATVVVASLLLGCGPSERNTGIEKGTAPTSPLTFAEAEQLASIAALSVGGTWSRIATTGSMEPVLNSNSVVIYRPYDGRLAVGNVVVFYRDADAPRVIHKVAALDATHFVGDGVSNSRYDGWQPRANIIEVMVGVIYAGGES